MKKVWILAALMVALAAMMASAQSPAKFGIKAGGTLADLTGDGASGTDSKFGFAGGLFMQVQLGQSGSLILQPEVLYVMKGCKTGYMGTDVKFKFDYIELPVLLKFNIPTEGNFNPNLFAGPAFGLKASSKASAEGVSVDVDDVKSFDLGIAFGGGFDVAMQTGSAVTFDARYTLGMTNIFDGEYEDVKNGVFMFMLGYRF